MDWLGTCRPPASTIRLTGRLARAGSARERAAFTTVVLTTQAAGQVRRVLIEVVVGRWAKFGVRPQQELKFSP